MIELDLIDRIMLDKLIDQCSQISDIGFCNGKMGIAIFFYNLSKRLDDPFFFKLADQLLDEVLNDISHCSKFDFMYGISGIGWGINYLVKSKFIDMYSDDLFDDFDQIISNKILEDDIELNDILSIGYYVLQRIDKNINRQSSKEQKNLMCTYILMLDALDAKINIGEQSPLIPDLLEKSESIPFLLYKIENIKYPDTYYRVDYLFPFVERQLFDNRILESYSCEEFYLEEAISTRKLGLHEGVAGMLFSRLIYN